MKGKADYANEKLDCKGWLIFSKFFQSQFKSPHIIQTKFVYEYNYSTQMAHMLHMTEISKLSSVVCSLLQQVKLESFVDTSCVDHKTEFILYNCNFYL